MCFSTCPVTQAPTSFSISAENSAATGAAATVVNGASQALPSNCNNDYVVIDGGFDPTAAPINAPTNALDRFCGEAFNVAPNTATSSTVCSNFHF